MCIVGSSALNDLKKQSENLPKLYLMSEVKGMVIKTCKKVR